MDAGKDAEKPGGDRARADLTELAAPDIGVPLNGERLRTPRRPDEKRWRMKIDVDAWGQWPYNCVKRQQHSGGDGR